MTAEQAMHDARLALMALRLEVRKEVADSVTAYVEAAFEALAAPQAPARCANCGHTEPHNGPSGDVPDACTHPMCNCGFFVAERASGATGSQTP